MSMSNIKLHAQCYILLFPGIYHNYNMRNVIIVYILVNMGYIWLGRHFGYVPMYATNASHISFPYISHPAHPWPNGTMRYALL